MPSKCAALILSIVAVRGYEAFWRSVLKAVEEELARRGLADRIFLGMGGDIVPSAPGPNGPVGTVMLENLREGIQSAEALIAIEQALEAKRLTGDLEKRCQAVVNERINACREHLLDNMSAQGWQERDRRLYMLAGEVEALRPIP